MSKRGRTSAAKAAASRRNGSKGGRPRKVKVTPEQVQAATEVLALRRIVTERAANVQVLIDLRDGLVPGASVQDRVRAVESLLDRDPQTARVGREERPMEDTRTPPKRFEIGAGPDFSAPAGWDLDAAPAPGTNGHERPAEAASGGAGEDAAPDPNTNGGGA